MSVLNFSKNRKINVGVSVSGDSRLEAVVIDAESKKVLSYKKVPLEYNFQTKEISDYMTFATTLKTLLFNEMGLTPKNTNITLTIPSIHFVTTQLPSTVDSPAAINAALAAMAQDSYLFKRNEPVVAYQTYDTGSKETMAVVYSAIQENVVNQIKEVMLSEVGVENFSINNPYASIINSLDYLDIIREQVDSNEVWNFVQITNNGFVLFSMIGTKVIEVNEMPLPLKTFAPDEIYESMALSLQNNLAMYPASSLFVLSRTDLLSAQVLLQNMELEGSVNFLENNKFIQEPFMEIDEKVDPDLAKIISVEVIGAALDSKDLPMNLCYMTNKDLEEEILGYVNLFGQEVAVNETFIKNAIYAAIGAVVFLAFTLYLICGAINSNLQNSIASYNTQKESLQKQIAEAKGEAEGNIENIIADITKNNSALAAYYTSIATDIPQNLWLTYFYTDDKGAVAIKGNTSDVSGIYSFFKSLKESVENSNINLTKLDYNDIDAVLSNGFGNKTISFEISNGAYKGSSSSAPAAPEDTSKSSNSNNSSNNSNNNNTGTQPGNNTDTSSSGAEDVPPLPPIEPPTD